jgi:hypothetical protein
MRPQATAYPTDGIDRMLLSRHMRLAENQPSVNAAKRLIARRKILH